MSLLDRLDSSVAFVGMILLCLLPPCLHTVPKLPSAYGSLPPAAPLTQLFFQSWLSHTLCSRLERFSTANNLSNLWCSKLQHVSTYAFCCWDDIFTQKWNCSSPNNLCKSPKSPSPSVFQPLYIMEFLLVLKQPSCDTVCVRNECWTPF